MTDDADEPLLRPYAVTGGRTPEPDRLDRATQVSTVTTDLGSPQLRLTPEHHHILGSCRRRPQSIAELAAAMNQPLGVVQVLVGDLVDYGAVRTRGPSAVLDDNVLEKVLSGLKQL